MISRDKTHAHEVAPWHGSEALPPNLRQRPEAFRNPGSSQVVQGLRPWWGARGARLLDASTSDGRTALTPANCVRALLLCLIAIGTMLAPAAANGPLVETPELAVEVAAGRLPPIAERVPKSPRRIDLTAMGRTPGKQGGELRLLMGDIKDLRMMVVYGYSRLVGYTEQLELAADILESFQVEDGRIFTLKIRTGHRWSDGHPFTAEDFRYFWQDVVLNKALSPGGPPVEMMVDGAAAEVEIVDPVTVRYTWPKPNPGFLPALAGARPLSIAMPAHYLKQFHASHVPADKLDALVKSKKLQNWVRLHERESRQYRPENPALPSLDPWIATTKPPSTRFVFARNPYFHRVDADGHQLPYISQVVITTVSQQLIAAKAASGESDLQARYIRFDNYTFLKEAERRGLIKVKLWERGEGSAVALIPNLNANDPGWRAALRDVRVRRALSLGINRREINMAIFYGLAHASANTVIPRSPLFEPGYQSRWAGFDIAAANRLLDDAGLSKRRSDGVRLLPNGQPAEMIIESSGESTQETDVLNLVRDSWGLIGIKVFPRATQRDLLRKRALSGDTVMSIWSGLDDATPTADRAPDEFAPTKQDQLQWPKWGLNFENRGQGGEAPDIPEALELLAQLAAWKLATEPAERARIWSRMLEINAEQVFTIGTVNRSLQPVVVSRRLRNVPDKAYFAFEPGGFFGMYMPDTFWLDQPNQ
jgi:peptide/nickel transport system substrate-binding protein